VSEQITPNEVAEWFFRKKPLPEQALVDIAYRLNRMRWRYGSLDEAQAFVERRTNDKLAHGTPPMKFNESLGQDHQWWDFERAHTAAVLLQVSMPLMIRHWKRLEKWPETARGYKAIKGLAVALDEALSYIEHPFGKPDADRSPRSGAKRREWHMHAVLIARLVVDASRAAKQSTPAISHSSALAKGVQKVLLRMGFGTVEYGAIGKYLTRYHRRFGLFAEEALSGVRTSS